MWLTVQITQCNIHTSHIIGLQDLDRYLGPYPHGSLKKWESLTNHITEGLLERIQPPGGKISSVAEIVPQTFTAAKSDTREEMEGQSRNSPGTERLTGSMIQFTEIPKKRFPEGASPSVISKYSIDSSYVLECMTATMKGKLITFCIPKVEVRLEYSWVVGGRGRGQVLLCASYAGTFCPIGYHVQGCVLWDTPTLEGPSFNFIVLCTKKKYSHRTHL